MNTFHKRLEARRVRAYQIMQRIYDDGMHFGVQDPATLAASIDAAYPWRHRRGYPYKAWLQARREFFERHKLPGLRPIKTIRDIAIELNLIPDSKDQP